MKHGKTASLQSRLFSQAQSSLTATAQTQFGHQLHQVNRDHDGDMLRLQPAHHVAPGGTGLAGWQRLGRSRARTGRGIHRTATTWWTKGLSCSNQWGYPS
uniref:(northern house mosquito) hypothetical protein n=1 Tax=Culex pipiens TaxID=7175 RepID=A0A8D8FAU2_CULPI